jgi:hypothetical protein
MNQKLSNTRRRIFLLLGVVGVLLGGFWLLQGLGAVQVRPLVCFANCEPIQGASGTWALIGGLVATVGVFAIAVSLKPRGRREKPIE